MDQIEVDNTSTFRKADREVQNVDRTNKEPECMVDRLNITDSTRQPLNDEEMKVARVALKNKVFMNLEFPKTQKFRDDPAINGQRYGLISFYPSKNATPDEDGCFGVLKVRGTFQTMKEADDWSENLVRNYDSMSEIDFIFVGKDFPIMVDNTIYTRTTREIDVSKKCDETFKSTMKTKASKEEQDKKEVFERQKALLDKTHQKEQATIFKDLDYYIQLRVKKANALMLIDNAQQKTKEAKAVIEKTNNDIEEIEKENPDYKEEYLQKYKNALSAVGASTSDAPLLNYMTKELADIQEEEDQVTFEEEKKEESN